MSNLAAPPSTTTLDTLRARCAAQDAALDARLRALRTPPKRRRNTVRAPASVCLRDAVPPPARNTHPALMDALRAEFGGVGTSSHKPRSRSAKAFGGDLAIGTKRTR